VTDLLAVARDAAEAAGALLLEHFARPRAALRSKSSPTDPVTEADLAAERLIRERIGAARPGDAVLGEEGGEPRPAEAGDGTVRWIVDPLDGTTNFLYGIPLWCVSVACEDADGPLAGVVHDPVRGETFAAARGGRATVNDEPVEASDADDAAHALVATGFGYTPERRAAQAAVVARVLPRVRDIRRGGAAALDLAWTACGRFDAYWERGVRPWDVAAGALVCERAGLVVRRLEAAGDLPDGLLAAPPALLGPLLELVGP
jgi:myo-inositol-1(or 4)-monophosphatase